MHCLSCDALLNTYEVKRKHKVTGEYLDLCSRCLKSIEEVVHIDYTGPKTDEVIEDDTDD
jgi:hypothetical protein